MCTQVICPGQNLTLAEFPFSTFNSHICYARFCKKSTLDIVSVISSFLEETCDNMKRCILCTYSLDSEKFGQGGDIFPLMATVSKTFLPATHKVFLENFSSLTRLCVSTVSYCIEHFMFKYIRLPPYKHLCLQGYLSLPVFYFQ